MRNYSISKAWTDNPQYSKFSDELVKSQDRGFEKLVLPLIKVIWPNIGNIPPGMGWIDKSGIDILEWSDNEPFPLAVQCKGFAVPEKQIGKKQIQQCLDSISSFKKSGLKVEIFLLIHNRTGQNGDLRQEVEKALKDIENSGQAIKAELWDRQRLLREVFNACAKLILDAIEDKRSSRQNEYNDYQICEPLEIVPFAESELTTNQNQLVNASNAIDRLGDPVIQLLDPNASKLHLIIGSAGYGKTTAVLRAFKDNNHLIFYVPAATIPSSVCTTAGLIRHIIKIEDLFEDLPNEDQEVFERLFLGVVGFIFKNSGLPIILLIDGLDESIYFSRRGGLQSLFNQIRDFDFPVILTTRKEFWSQRQQDFSEFCGISRSSSIKRTKRVQLIELLEWGSTQIGDLARKYQATLSVKSQRDNLQEFIEIADLDLYENYYGDIPKSPLFLRLILETVAQIGVRSTGRARLYYDWAEYKIRRDVTRPMSWGDFGRQPIISETESPEQTLQLSFRAMMLASQQMTSIRGKEIELLSECAIDNVLKSDVSLMNVSDPTGLLLNSLLVPIKSRPHDLLRICFAHRAFQEFFFALSVHLNREKYTNFILPQSIKEQLLDIETEGI